MNRNLTAFLLLVIAIGSYLAFAGMKSEPVDVEPEPEEWVMDHSLAMFLDDFSRKIEEDLIEEEIPGAAVVIVKEGRVIFQKGFGVK